jgi:RNA polymerase sigma-70 factor, ECF subfamily
MSELGAIDNFSEHEEFFKQQTGNNFTFYYKKYYPKLIYYTTKMCRDQQRAEDVTIESFLTAFNKIDKYEKEKSQFSTWLFTIARNIMLQEMKNEKKNISIDVEFDEEGTTMKDFIQEQYDFSNEKEAALVKAEIMLNQIQKLKEPYRTVIEMREIKKMSYQDIADELGICLSTLKSRIRNGRHLLISQTKKEFEKIDEKFSE